MSRKQLALFEPTLVVQALKEAVKKLNPQAQWRNPVMFIVWIGSLLTTCISIAMASGVMPGNALFSAAISGWLWVTVLFANFAEALAEGRSKAQANSLKGVKKPLLLASCANRNMALRQTKFLPINCVKAISYW
ncbi:kdpB domain protein [Escherichia coli DEC1B]|nr:kdpB domain protein [Escherichia coli DEC1B]